MDLNHGMPFVRPVKIYNGRWKLQKFDIIIISAKANQKPGETKLTWYIEYADFKEIIRNILKYYKVQFTSGYQSCRHTYHVTYKISDCHIISYRFRYCPWYCSIKVSHCRPCGIDARNVHGYIIGEHGDSELAAWSTANIAGIPIDEYCDKCQKCEKKLSQLHIFENVKNAAYEIIDRKGATYYAVALAVRRIVEAIIRDENSILTVSSLVDGLYVIYLYLIVKWNFW